MRVLWLDDGLETIRHEKLLISEHNENIDINIFEKIDEFLEFLEQNEITEDTIFIIDVMLTNEDRIMFKDIDVTIPEELMAGVHLFNECLDKFFPEIPVILYTSRGGDDEEIFKEVQANDRYSKSLFVIGKEELETKFKDTIKKLGLKVW